MKREAVKAEDAKEASAELPSDEEIKRRLAPMILGGDLEAMTLRTVVKQLEASFGGVRLKPRKRMISEEITRLVNSAEENAGAGAEPDGLAESKAGAKAAAERQAGEAQAAKEQLVRRVPKKPGFAAGSSSSSSSASSYPPPRVPPMLVESSSSGRGATKPVHVSPELASFLNLPWTKDLKLPRTQVVKTLCAYVKENELQDPEDRRHIVCDGGLRELLGQDRVTFFSMNKYLSRHFAKGPPRKPREKKGGTPGGAFNAGKRLSPKLEAVVGEGPMSRPQVVKQLWVYIKARDLQDPADKRYIMCDDALRAVMGTDRVHMMKMSKMLSNHIYNDGEQVADESEKKSKKKKKKSKKEKKRKKKAKREAEGDDDEDGDDDDDEDGDDVGGGGGGGGGGDDDDDDMPPLD